MKNLTIGFIVVVFIACAVLLFFQRQAQDKLRVENEGLTQQLAQLQSDIEGLSNRLTLGGDSKSLSEEQLNELLRLRGQVGVLRQQTNELAQANADILNDPTASMAKSWLVKVNKLKQLLNQMPDRKIPELQYAVDQDWFDVTRDADLGTDAGVRKALSELRSKAKMRFSSTISKALVNYADNNDGQLPSDIMQLQAYCSSPVDGALLQRYEMLQAGSLSDARGKWLVTEIAPVDKDYDTRYYISISGIQGSDVKDYAPDSPMAQKYPAIHK